MAKVAVAVRLRPEVIERVDAVARRLEVSRQVILESAVGSFLDDCERGTPDLVAEVPRPKAKARPKPPSQADVVMMERQWRLNAGRDRARR